MYDLQFNDFQKNDLVLLLVIVYIHSTEYGNFFQEKFET